MTSPSRTVKIFEARLTIEDFTFTALFDEKGRLLHLTFGEEPEPRVLKRMARYFPGARIEEGAPLPWRSELQRVLQGYLEGRARELPFPVRFWGTPFEKRVWETISEIPYGEVRTYAWVAERLGKPGALRAVGRALAANPLPLFIPCHRIVARRGLGGFSQGLEIKRMLLELEGVLRQ